MGSNATIDEVLAAVLALHDATVQGFTSVDRRFTRVEERLDGHDKRFVLLENEMRAGFRQVDERFRQVNERFRQVDERFRQVNERFRQVNERLDGLSERVGRLESRRRGKRSP